MTTSKLVLWLLQSAIAAALVLVVLTSPVMAQAGGGHQPPVEGETCTQTCDRWQANGFEECRNSAHPAQCNQNLGNNCRTACNNGTPPVASLATARQTPPPVARPRAVAWRRPTQHLGPGGAATVVGLMDRVRTRFAPTRKLGTLIPTALVATEI